MSRLSRIALAVLPSTIVTAALALPAFKPGRPDQVKTAIFNYLHYRTSVSQQTSSVQQIIVAAQPGYFTPQISKATFGHSVYFQTSHQYPTRGGPATATPWPGELPSTGKGLRPLPFPPAAVWCVLLRSAGQATPDAVFVAQHQDDYKADWIVHEPTAETASELQASLSSVGCDVVVDQ